MGAIAETAVTAAATKLGISVLRPIVEHGRYDLAFEIADRILRVQCKWGGLHDERSVMKVQLQSSWLSPTAGYVLSSYALDENRSSRRLLRGTGPLLPSAEFARSRSAGDPFEGRAAQERPAGLH